MNLLPARLANDHAWVDGHDIKLDAAYPTLAADASVQIGVRPDHVVLTAPGAGPRAKSSVSTIWAGPGSPVCGSARTGSSPPCRTISLASR